MRTVLANAFFISNYSDRVNTAARMESTGKRGKIQCSKSTADIIEASGKPQWLSRRKEVVAAKGKGTMQTWWVNPTGRKGPGRHSGGGSDTSAKESSSLSSNSLEESVKEVNQRLVSWMAELLMDDVKKIVHTRRQCGIKDANLDLTYYRPEGSTLLDEVQTEIKMPKFNAHAAENVGDHTTEEIGPEIFEQLRLYVSEIASMYQYVYYGRSTCCFAASVCL